MSETDRYARIKERSIEGNAGKTGRNEESIRHQEKDFRMGLMCL